MTSTGFLDRSSELEEIEQIIEAAAQREPRWLALIGLRKIGKTSVLLEAARRAKERAVDVVVIDTTEVDPPSLEFFRRYALRVVDRMLGVEAGVSLEQLAEQPDEYRDTVTSLETFSRLERTTRMAVSGLASAKPGASLLRQALELPEQLARELSRPLVVAIDEFQEIAALRGPRKVGDPLPVMRSLWQRHEHVGYIISGSARAMLLELVSSQHSPFFQHFAVLELTLFREDDAIRLLTESTPADRPISRATAARAFRALGGHPFYLQLFGETLTAEPGPYDEPAFKDALQSLLFSKTGRLALYFEAEHGRLVGRSTMLSALLDTLSSGSKRLAELARAISASPGSTSHYLERLGDAVVKNSSGAYEIVDRSFARWLEWRRPGGTVVPMALVGDEAEKRVAEHLARLGFDLVYQSRGSRGAFDLLATHGAEQLGLQVKRSPLPLRFRKGDWDRMDSDAKRFGWRWAIAAVDDEDGVLILDPRRVRRGRESTLGKSAAIENVLEWLFGPLPIRPSAAPRRRVKTNG